MNAPVTETRAREVGRWSDIFYRAWPTKRDYSFTFVFERDGWKVYINNSPDYGRRAPGSVETHRLDLWGHPYVCWNTTIPTLSKAQAVAALWADSTENYIATGRFEPVPGRPKVQDRTVLNGYPAPTIRPRATPASPAAPVRIAHQPAPRKSWWARVKDQFEN